MAEAFAGYGVLENSGEFSGLASGEAIERMSVTCRGRPASATPP